MKARYLNPKVYDLYYDGPPEYLRRVTREKVIIKVDGGWEGVDSTSSPWLMWLNTMLMRRGISYPVAEH